ncbi:hypothetical protein FPRO03_02642 [Fusarium proliferatum]|nr:hypothetical protein FPRO03_02642 [Fusarium proliferatum]
MVLHLESYFFSVLVFLLEKLVYFENWWYESAWSYWRPSSTAILDKLVKSREDEIWHAVIFGKDGDVRRAFGNLANKPEARVASPNVSGNGVAALSPSTIEAGASSYPPNTKLKAAVETAVKEHEDFDRVEDCEMAVQARLEVIADQLANSSRALTKKEREQVHETGLYLGSGTISLLWMAIHQNHKSDVDYLLSEHNQKLHKGSRWNQETVLHRAVSNNDLNLVRDILEKSSYTSPHTYINVGDSGSRTSLHELVSSLCSASRYPDPESLGHTFEILDLLSRYGANINALDMSFRTPLHLLLSRTLICKNYLPEELSSIPIDPLMDKLLRAGAEVNTKDFQGVTPLHIACELRNMDAIAKLVRNGADLGSLNLEGKTPKRVFSDSQGPDEDFWKRMLILSRNKQRTVPDLSTPGSKLSKRQCRVSKAAIAVCHRSPVYCRYQWSDLATASNDPPHWTATDKYVSHVFHLDKQSEDVTFLAECEEECRRSWYDLVELSQKDGEEHELDHKDTTGKIAEVDSSTKVASYTWRWVNFPANNITWVRDFIEDNLEINNIEDHMELLDMRNKISLIRVPHAHTMSQGTSKPTDQVKNTDTKTRSIVSLVIPFLDIEVEGSCGSTTTRIDEAYPPFDGLNGVQTPQTLDQTSINAESTVLSAIPCRTNVCMANDLLETIRQSGLNGVYGSDDLVKHILQETITFPDKFLRAGLGEHILDVFESEIAAEADEEATFYNNFAQNDWNSKHANRAISCTWRVKDIRDELRLIRNVFESQLKVVEQFSKVLAEQPVQTPEDSNFIPSLKSKLEGIMQRIDSMDSEANKTTESLNNITQAMLAQAALKEAESARLMNFIILPFTIVTVIFTPLSFMTSLFAVNSDGFPHNEDGELRIPSEWFWRRMVIGEFGTLVPLFIFVLFLYYWRRSPGNLSREQPGR